MIDRQQILDSHPITEFISSYGISLSKSGNGLKGLCPFHNEKTGSFHVYPEKQNFHCFGCGMHGTVIDFVMKKEGLNVKQAMEKLAGKLSNEKQIQPKKESKIVAKYEYQDEQGETLYKVFRFEPKTFRQAHQVNGKVIWSMEGVKRVLYRLPQIIKSEEIIVCEGEKDVDNIARIGFQSTCNVGGAGKWMEAYTESLRGKSIIIIPDNDEPGLKHLEKVRQSLTGRVKSLKVVKVPQEFKDISDWIEKNPSINHKEQIQQWINEANVVGLDIPIYSISEMGERYKEFIKRSEESMLKFDWIPQFKKYLTGLVPGDVMAILADTGTGKTAILQNIARHARPLIVTFFEMELSEPLLFKRFTQLNYKVEGKQVEDAFKSDINLGNYEDMNHIYTCSKSRLTTEEIEKIIVQSELKIGQRPQVVIIDYIGLIHAEGKSRYEKLSNIAEEIKRMAKATNTIIIVTSQVSRKKDDDGEIYLHDAKDSGSIENSAGLVLGCWKEAQDKMMIKILKNTSGSSGWKVPVKFDGKTMTISEWIEKPSKEQKDKDVLIRA